MQLSANLMGPILNSLMKEKIIYLVLSMLIANLFANIQSYKIFNFPLIYPGTVAEHCLGNEYSTVLSSANNINLNASVQ